MSEKKKKKLNGSLKAAIILLAVADFVLLLSYLLRGKNVALFNSKGLIATEQHKLMMFTVTILLMIAIPTLSFLFYTVWKYRESNAPTEEAPAAHHSKYLVAGFWLLPTAIVILLASVMWPATHRLAPQKVIASDTMPLTIQVISLRWKWLFLYPEQGIASVNFVQLPLNTPVTFEMTADETPMSSFWIPNLGGQLYTMTSHSNRLNLMADKAGDYPGSSAEINGEGFAGMKFIARAGTAEDFDQWVQNTKQSPDVLDAATYDKVLAPSENNPMAFYSAYESDLYDKVISKYTDPAGGHTH